MKLFKLKYLFVFLFTISVFHLTGAECDEDESPTGSSGVDEAAIGKWVSTRNDTVKRWMEITKTNITVYELWNEEGDGWPLQLYAQKVIDGTYLTPYQDTIRVDFFGTKLNIGISVNSGVTPKTLNFSIPVLNEVLNFEEGEFTPDSTFNVNPELIGTWKNIKAEEYLNVINYDDYKLWVMGEGCYNNVQSNSYEFTSQFSGIYYADDLDGGEGSFTYKENDTLILEYYPLTANFNLNSKLEVFNPPDTDTLIKVSDNDFEGNECP
jgi:hypothetical protein